MIEDIPKYKKKKVSNISKVHSKNTYLKNILKMFGLNIFQ